MMRSTGFTLVEMMIAVVIMAILLAVGMPGFQAFIQNTQIRTAADSMQAGLNLARAEALRRNARVSLWVVSGIDATCVQSNTGNSWVVSFTDPAARCGAAASDSAAPGLIQARSGSDGSSGVNVTALTGADAASSCITFNGFGGVETTCTGGASPLARISFVSAAAPATTRALEVHVTPGGAIRMCDPNAADGTPTRC
ncbi:GspH/FimT family pseudopilin [Noviherbaspirillum cavernae]|nr:GspH/FimT family pseudopilin [Noviherbaspirillum cavernae]